MGSAPSPAGRSGAAAQRAAATAGRERSEQKEVTIRRVDKGRNHWYENESGQRVPGATGILDKSIPKQGVLTGWAGRQGGDYVLDHWDELVAMKPSERYRAVAYAHRRRNEAAKVNGTRVHLLGAAVAAGEEVAVPAELIGYVEAYTQFLYDFDVTVFMSEAVVWSKVHGYCGTLDMGATLSAGVTTNPSGDDVLLAEDWLIDVKTGSGVYDEVAFQLAAYRYADVWIEYPDDGDPIEHEMPAFDRCGVLHVREDGYDLVPVEAGVLAHRGFLYLKQAAEEIEANKGAVGEPLEPPIRMEF
jgi:hypothetical protein